MNRNAPPWPWSWLLVAVVIGWIAFILVTTWTP